MRNLRFLRSFGDMLLFLVKMQKKADFKVSPAK